MHNNLRIVCVIPARLASTRFPRKILATLANKPLLEWVWNAAKSTKQFDDVLFAIDSKETGDLLDSFGAAYEMTSSECASGTDRLIEIMESGKRKADIWVNWQGDEPFITHKLISQLLASCDDNSVDVWTLKKRIVHENEIHAPNIAKVVCDVHGNAMYFSRSMIPFYREGSVTEKVFYKHVGLYAYTTDALKKISRLPVSFLESAECLEQLRFLQNGLKIRMHETDVEVIGIDTPDDLIRAEKMAASFSLSL